ncbi:hypothetical protein B8W90_14095, partial [Staphylococcus hominis]
RVVAQRIHRAGEVLVDLVDDQVDFTGGEIQRGGTQVIVGAAVVVVAAPAAVDAAGRDRAAGVVRIEMERAI